MQSGNFYFVKDEFYEKFPNCGLMANGVSDEEGKHGRPCFYAKQIEKFFWLIPISSRVEKYQKIYEEKISKYPNYDGIKFGYVNGKKRAFCKIVKHMLQKSLEKFIRGFIPQRTHGDIIGI